MKSCVVLLFLIPGVLVGQQAASLPGDIRLEFRSTDPSRVLDVAVGVRGGVFGSIGVLRPAPGQVRCGPEGCTATTPAVLELTLRRGDGRISVSEGSPELEVTVIGADAPQRRLVARGHLVTFSRDAEGQVQVRAPQIMWRF